MELPSAAFFISEEQIVEFLNFAEHKQSSENLELAVSVWACRIYKHKYNKPYFVSFQLKDELKRLMPNFDGKNLDHIQKVLRHYLKKDTIVDFAIVPGPLNEYRNTGHAFQIKRVGREFRSDFTSKLADEINAICKKFKTGETGLIVIPEIGPYLKREEIDKISMETDVAPIAEKIIVPTDSFKVVWLLNKTPNKVWMTQVYPDIRTFGGFPTKLLPSKS
ncbi:hypothetical protein HYW35_01605 [Candidatus Saccharibacteria bacterium]|nr:hypothetical protein [Candidatus Saccharibacteria bacterium]